jgi:hypothetical protein
MDNKQLRTSMVTKLLSNTVWHDGIDSDAFIDETIESASRVVAWRNSQNLSMSIASRGPSEYNWYMDLLVNPQTGWREMMELFQIHLDMVVSIKNPQKVLAFNPDIFFMPYVNKIAKTGVEMHFVNNQALYNFEKFCRDESEVLVDSKSIRDIDYGVVEYEEIGSSESTGYEFIHGCAWEFMYDSDFLAKCINSLASGGVLLISSTNNSGKLYRDDYQFHPLNEMHDVLKSSNGRTFHNSEAYGFTAFVKD